MFVDISAHLSANFFLRLNSPECLGTHKTVSIGDRVRLLGCFR